MSNTLFRNVVKNSVYDKLIKKGNCKKLFSGNGNTFFTIDLMIKNIIKNSHQANLIAPKLTGRNLKETCTNIHNFLYTHFQYKQDEIPQMLRSLECSYKERFTGIDCKSYTIAGGIILREMNLKFHIRKIIQFDKNYNIGLGNYSHVYLIVPIDQISGTLKKGYYTIDGTLPTMEEPHYMEEKSFFMDKMPHYSLNGLSEANLDWAKDLFKKLSLDKLFGSISCWGGTAFDANILKALIPVMTNYFLNNIAEYNRAIEEKRFNDVHKIYVDYWLKKDALYKTYIKKFQSKNWNDCTDASFNFVFSFLDKKISQVLGLAYEKHIVTYFNIGNDRNNKLNFTQPANTPDTFDGVYMWGTAIPNSVSVQDFSYSVNVTPKTDQIPAFIITPEIQNALNSDVQSSSINLNSVLQTIATTAPILYSVFGGEDIANNPNLIYDNENSTGDFEYVEDKPKQAGGGWLLLLIGLGIAFGATKFNQKDKKDAK